MYLKRIGKTLYFYCRVPKDLIPFLQRRELKKSLKTTDRRAAKIAAKAYALELERLGVYVRTGIMDDMQLQRALQKFKDSFLLGIESMRDRGATAWDFLEHQALSGRPVEGVNVNFEFRHLTNLLGDDSGNTEPDTAIQEYSRRMREIREELKVGRFSDETRWEARQLVKEYGLDTELPPTDWFNINDDAWNEPVKGDFLKIMRRLLQTKLDMYTIELDRLHGNYSNAYDLQSRNKRPPYLLSEAIRDFCLWRRKERGGKPRTQARYEEYFNVMLPILGDRDVTDYTRRDLEDLKAQLYERTANLNKNPKIKKPLDKRTVNTNYLGKIGSLFRWLHTTDRVDKDLTQGLVTALTKTELKARKRKPYDADDLERIFSLLPYDPKQPHLAFVPLVAVYSGARQGEICQLLTCDIKEAHGILYMHITEEDDDGNIVKTVKNENSKRLVPLHPVIIEMGFLDFVEKRKAQGKKVLFETRSHKPLTGQYYSKRFRVFNREHITKDAKKVFHSFRHLVHNELKQKLVPSDVYHSITGHSAQHEMDQVYTEDHILQNKYDALIKLEYTGLNLALLKERFKALL